MLAGCSRGSDNFQVHLVRGGDVDGLNFGMIDNPPPVGHGLAKTHRALSLLGACLDVVRTNHELGVDAAFRKAPPDLKIRAAVQLAHPAHADHTNADLVRHSF